MNRRRFLATSTTVGATLLAGCTSSGDSGADPTTATTSEPTTVRTTERETTEPTTTTEAADTLPYNASAVKDNADSIGYEELFRNFEDYEGEYVYFEHAYVYQVIYADDDVNYDYLQMNVSQNTEEWTGDVAAAWYRDGRLLEEDYLEFWGVAEQLYTYTTVEGNERTIPFITMVAHELYDDE